MNEKTALVTGADGGLGIHVTKALLDAGFLVVGLAPKIKQSNFDSHRFTALPARLDSLEAAKQSADAVMTKFGKIDVVAHLVGGFAGGPSVTETDDATFRRMFEMNVDSAFHILRAVLPHRHWQSRGRKPGARCRSIQRLQSRPGLADTNRGARKQKFRNHRQCHSAGDDRHSRESQGDARSRYLSLDSARRDWKLDSVASH